MRHFRKTKTSSEKNVFSHPVACFELIQRCTPIAPIASMSNVQTTFGLLFQQFGLSQFRRGHNCFNGVESASFSKRNNERTATLWSSLLRGWILTSLIQELNVISPIYSHHRHLLPPSFSVMSVAKFYFNWNPLEICIGKVYYKKCPIIAKSAFSRFNDLTVDILMFTNSG